ncbi:hypothetical protein DL93DRAFT_2074704 [Clavulina sp. PMI_390]|nr:hypothetical protein DL93DRAFT_2074704 [Clavulina sp. PMI_390]
MRLGRKRRSFQRSQFIPYHAVQIVTLGRESRILTKAISWPHNASATSHASKTYVSNHFIVLGSEQEQPMQSTTMVSCHVYSGATYVSTILTISVQRSARNLYNISGNFFHCQLTIMIFPSVKRRNISLIMLAQTRHGIVRCCRKKCATFQDLGDAIAGISESDTWTISAIS